MIVVDASGVPDMLTGERTRLRGLLQAYARIPDAPPLAVRVAHFSKLLNGTKLGPIKVEEVDNPGGPIERALKSFRRRPAVGTLERECTLWHSETIPPLAPTGVPELLTLHDLRWHEPRDQTGGKWLDWSLRNAAAHLWLPRVVRRIAGVVTVSRATMRLIVERLAIPADRVTVVPNAVDAAASLPSESVQRGLCDALHLEPRSYFIAVGRLETRKGLDLAIDAFAAAPKESLLAKAKLLIVGEGPLRSALMSRAMNLGVSARVLFPGQRDDVGVASLIAQSAGLVFPSYIEGFGFPVHEALARGVPALASALPCFSDLVPLSPRGLTLLPRDRAAWTAAMERTLAGVALPAPRAALPASVPSWDDSANALVKLYRKTALGGAAPKR